MKLLLNKTDFNSLINDWIKQQKVVSVKSKFETEKVKKNYFDVISNAEEIDWDYVSTILSPKKFIYPQVETLLKYNSKGDVDAVFDNSKQILLGLHPCDINAISMLDDAFKGDNNIDRNYFERRNNTIIIGFDCSTKCDKSFCASMKSYRVSEGYDVYLRFIDDDVLIEAVSDSGKALFDNISSKEICSAILDKEQAGIKERLKLFIDDEISASKNVLPALLEKTYNSKLWKEIGDKCLSCGSCNIVCPTCYCFDVRDENDLSLDGGERKRYWDACQLKGFTKVAGNEVFRKTKAGRNRHRIFRKFKYLDERYNDIFCVGCGRCNRACLADINIVDIFNDLNDIVKSTTYIKPVSFVTKEDSIYKPKMAKIINAKQFTANEKWFELQFEDGTDLGHAPGQFVNVSVMGVGEAPISVSSAPTKKGSFELCLRKIGNVTNNIHKLDVGDKVGIRGPFGRGFPYKKMAYKDVLFVVGGLGLIPARSLINYVLDNREQFNRVIILYGCKNPTELLYVDELKQWTNRDDIEYHVTVDKANDSWQGNVGVITTLFSKVKINSLNTAAVIVGPPIMYKFVILELLSRSLLYDNIYMSLERRMKCGVGKCGHCQINGIYVCQEGPVFSYKESLNLEEAI
jgi:sulfite reductase subunit B